MDENNKFGNIKIKLENDWIFDNENYKRNKKHIALKKDKDVFLSLGGRFYFLLPKDEYKEVSNK